MLSKEFKNIQQVLPAAWTRNTIAIAAQLHNKTIYVVGHYTQPDQKSRTDQELTEFVNYINRTKRRRIIIAGDLNRNIQALT